MCDPTPSSSVVYCLLVERSLVGDTRLPAGNVSSFSREGMGRVGRISVRTSEDGLRGFIPGPINTPGWEVETQLWSGGGWGSD